MKIDVYLYKEIDFEIGFNVSFHKAGIDKILYLGKWSLCVDIMW